MSSGIIEAPRMSLVHRPLLVLALTIIAAALASCDNNPVGPGTGSGNLLKATIDGTSYTFTLDEVRYDSTIQYAYVFGNASGAASKSITITFVSDITSGTFPRTLGADDVNIIYIDLSGGQELTYDCTTHRECSMTLTNSQSGIVDGTFSGTLTDRANSSRRVSVTQGQFSVDLL